MNKINNIKDLYSQIEEKTKFILSVADYLKLNPQYVRGHYFSGFWIIPDKYQDTIIKLLQKKIAQQNKVITKS